MKLFGSSFNDDTCDILVKNLDKEDFTSNMSIQEYNVGFVRYIFSYITIGILVALVIVLFIWIALIVDRKGRHLTGFYGNIFLVSGLIVFLSGVAVALGAFGSLFVYKRDSILSCGKRPSSVCTRSTLPRLC